MRNKRCNSSVKSTVTIYDYCLVLVKKTLVVISLVLLSQLPTLAEEPQHNPSDFSNEPFFVENAVEKLGGKFPFDLLGDTVTVTGSNECPNYTFYGEQIELCFLNTVLNAVKIPAQVGIGVLLFWRI